MEPKNVKCDIEGLLYALQTIKEDHGNIPVFAQYKKELLWLHNFRIEIAGDTTAVIIAVDYNPFILSDGSLVSHETH